MKSTTSNSLGGQSWENSIQFYTLDQGTGCLFDVGRHVDTNDRSTIDAVGENSSTEHCLLRSSEWANTMGDQILRIITLVFLNG